VGSEDLAANHDVMQIVEVCLFMLAWWSIWIKKKEANFDEAYTISSANLV